MESRRNKGTAGRAVPASQRHAARKPAAVLLAVFGIFLCLSPATALDFKVSAAGRYSTETANAATVEGVFGIEHREGPFSMSWDLVADNLGTYPEPFLADFFGDFSVDIRNAGIGYTAGPLELYMGKLPLKDEIDSPYSLFLSGVAPSVITAGFEYRAGAFSFTDRWVGLDRTTEPGLYNTTASGIYADRGMVMKTYSLELGRLRFGYQDATLFTGSYFDFDVFANPAPSFFLQYVLSASGRPGSRSGDQNSIMGLFGSYRGDGWKAWAQLLVDDFNTNRILKPGSYQNPDKLAWNLGGSLDLPLGVLGLHTAGATKYTFESVRDRFYSYTLHPGSAVISDGQTVAVPLADQMLGYVNGENNVAFMATWSAPLAGFDVETGLEFVVSGAKSPANPWHNGEDWASLGTQLLNDPVLEYRTLLDLRLSRSFGDLAVALQLSGGYLANRLNPRYPGSDPSFPVDTETTTPSMEPVFFPVSGDSGFVFEISLGGTWKLRL